MLHPKRGGEEEELRGLIVLTGNMKVRSFRE